MYEISNATSIVFSKAYGQDDTQPSYNYTISLNPALKCVERDQLEKFDSNQLARMKRNLPWITKNRDCALKIMNCTVMPFALDGDESEIIANKVLNNLYIYVAC